MHKDLAKKYAEKLIGKKFGRLLVLSEHSIKYKKRYFLCRCDCGSETAINGTSIRVGHSKRCRYCKPKAKDNPLFTGVGDIAMNWWYKHVTKRIERSKKNIKYTITVKYAWKLFLRQKRRCAITGLLIYFPEHCRKNGTASLDRINNKKGYEKRNVQWVHKNINLMKGMLEQEEFIKLCKSVAEYN